MGHFKFQKTSSPKQATSSGFLIPLVFSVLVVLTIGGATLITRGFGGLIGSVRQQNSRAAREAAESGLAITLEALNDRYSYLLLNCYERQEGLLVNDGDNSCTDERTWANPDPSLTQCQTIISGYPEEIDLNDEKSRYTIDYYAYDGNDAYGGTGRLRITGEVIDGTGDNARVLASSTLLQEFNITPTACPAGSGFPGLLGIDGMNLGGNDVRGFTSGNVFCLSCTVNNPDSDDGTYTREELEDAVGASRNSDVDGQIYIGNISLPPVETFPDNLVATETSISGTSTITANDSNGGMCATDSTGVTHCKISEINLTGKKRLTVDSTAGPVNLYISGDVNAGGNAGIYHIWDDPNADPPATRLSLFGNPRQGEEADPQCREDPDYTNQSVTLAGSSKPQKAAYLFAYFPCAETGINGGGGEDPICDGDPPECGGGDVEGAVWTKLWGLSNSNVATLTVPANMREQLKARFGDQFDVKILRYVAQGVKDWRGFQGLSQ